MFDWRGTLVTAPTEREWVIDSLRSVGMSTSAADDVLHSIEVANGPKDRLDGPGVDSDADVHRRVFMEVFAEARLPQDLAEALYAAEADPTRNPFAQDAHSTLAALRTAGLRVGVISDIHFDLRPAFAAAGMLDLVDAFTLSFEQGIQKPDPLMFTRTAEALGVSPARCLMVGDRSRPDGAAVEQGMTTLLVPPLLQVGDQRLHRVLALCGVTRQGS